MKYLPVLLLLGYTQANTDYSYMSNAPALQEKQFDWNIGSWVKPENEKYAEFGIGFAAGFFPALAQFSDNECISHSGSFSIALMKIYILQDLIASGKARWWHYIKLTFWISNAISEWPQVTYHCRGYFTWMYDFF